MRADHRGLRGRAFVALVLAQLLGALADNALLIAAIALLTERAAALWMAPALRISFYAAYLLLAPLAGRVADALPKPYVLRATAVAKLLGCLLLFANLHPLLAYALIGAAAAAGAPARYGILPQLLTPAELVAGNAWLEGVTVAAILFGVGLGSVLLGSPGVGVAATQYGAGHAAVGAIAGIYLLTVLATMLIPMVYAPALSQSTHQKAKLMGAPALSGSGDYLRTFWRCQARLWRDRLGGIAIAVTCLFWAMAAVLQFLVLRWGELVGHLSLAVSSLLQLPVALGMIAGAACAGGRIRITRAPHLVPLGLVIGALVLSLALVHTWQVLVGLLAMIGILSGLLLIPMNALLQHRGHALMASGQSIAVQNFGENLVSVLLLSLYGGLVAAGFSVAALTLACGMVVLAVLTAILLWQRRQRNHPLPLEHGSARG